MPARRLVRVLLVVAVLATPGAVGVPYAQAAAEPRCQGRVPTIAATENGQRVRGTDGPDVISTGEFTGVYVDGRGGDDLVCSTAWTQAVVRGGTGDDVFVDQLGSASDPDSDVEPTLIESGPGNDRVVGGPGTRTTASYRGSATGVRIDLAAGVVADREERDVLVGIVSVSGSRHADRFTGSAGRDVYETGAAGWRRPDPDDRDRVDTRGGDDAVYGSNAVVRLGPGDDHGGVANSRVHAGSGNDVVNLAARGLVRGGPGNDRLTAESDFEELPRQQVAARLYGDGGDDTLQPAVAWSDGGSGGCPGGCRARLDGGAGRNTLELIGSGNRVDLETGALAAHGARATLRNLDAVIGTSGADVILGSSADGGRDRIYGMGGRDTLFGRGGRDVLIGGRGRDRVDGGPGRDRCEGEILRSC